MVDYFVMRPWRGVETFYLTITRALGGAVITPDELTSIWIYSVGHATFVWVDGNNAWGGPYWSLVDGVWYYDNGAGTTCTYTIATNKWEIPIAEDGVHSDDGYWVAVSADYNVLDIQVVSDEESAPDIYKTAEMEQESGLIQAGEYVAEMPYWEVQDKYIDDVITELAGLPACRWDSVTYDKFVNTNNPRMLYAQTPWTVKRAITSSVPYKIIYSMVPHWVATFYYYEVSGPGGCSGSWDCNNTAYVQPPSGIPLISYVSGDAVLNRTVNKIETSPANLQLVSTSSAISDYAVAGSETYSVVISKEVPDETETMFGCPAEFLAQAITAQNASIPYISVINISFDYE